MCLGDGESVDLLSFESSLNAYQVLLDQFVCLICFKLRPEAHCGVWTDQPAA